MNTKQKGRAREILAANVYTRMLVRYQGKPSDNARITTLAKESGVGRRTIQRILTPDLHDHDILLGSVEDLAKALRCETYELLKEPEPED